MIPSHISPWSLFSYTMVAGPIIMVSPWKSVYPSVRPSRVRRLFVVSFVDDDLSNLQ